MTLERDTVCFNVYVLMLTLVLFQIQEYFEYHRYHLLFVVYLDIS